MDEYSVYGIVRIKKSLYENPWMEGNSDALSGALELVLEPEVHDENKRSYIGMYTTEVDGDHSGQTLWFCDRRYLFVVISIILVLQMLLSDDVTRIKYSDVRIPLNISFLIIAMYPLAMTFFSIMVEFSAYRWYKVLSRCRVYIFFWIFFLYFVSMKNILCAIASSIDFPVLLVYLTVISISFLVVESILWMKECYIVHKYGSYAFPIAAFSMGVLAEGFLIVQELFIEERHFIDEGFSLYESKYYHLFSYIPSFVALALLLLPIIGIETRKKGDIVCGHFRVFWSIWSFLMPLFIVATTWNTEKFFDLNIFQNPKGDFEHILFSFFVFVIGTISYAFVIFMFIIYAVIYIIINCVRYILGMPELESPASYLLGRMLFGDRLTQ